MDIFILGFEQHPCQFFWWGMCYIDDKSQIPFSSMGSNIVGFLETLLPSACIQTAACR